MIVEVRKGVHADDEAKGGEDEDGKLEVGDCWPFVGKLSVSALDQLDLDYLCC